MPEENYLTIGSLELENIIFKKSETSIKPIRETLKRSRGIDYLDHLDKLLSVHAEIIFYEIQNKFSSNVTVEFIEGCLINRLNSGE